METLISTKNLNENNYMEIGIDDNMAVLYVYKDNELFDYHFFGASFEQEMKNLIDCFRIVHNTEPNIKLIKEFRNWCKALKQKGVID